MVWVLLQDWNSVKDWTKQNHSLVVFTIGENDDKRLKLFGSILRIGLCNGPWRSSHVLCKNLLRTGKSGLELGVKLSNSGILTGIERQPLMSYYAEESMTKQYCPVTQYIMNNCWLNGLNKRWVCGLVYAKTLIRQYLNNVSSSNDKNFICFCFILYKSLGFNFSWGIFFHLPRVEILEMGNVKPGLPDSSGQSVTRNKIQ